jgi:hypothetical protein
VSGFPWITLITAVVPAAGVLAGSALTGRQTGRVARAAELKADYAALVKAATELINHHQRVWGEGLGSITPEEASSFNARTDDLANALRMALAVVELSGSDRARLVAEILAGGVDGHVTRHIVFRDGQPRGEMNLFGTTADGFAASVKHFMAVVRDEIGAVAPLPWPRRVYLRVRRTYNRMRFGARDITDLPPK